MYFYDYLFAFRVHVFFSVDTTEKEDNFLWNINVDEDSQEPLEEESRETGDENR